MNILFLTHRLPFAPNRGDRIRAFHILRTLSATATIDLVSLVHDAEEASHAADLRDVCRSVSVGRAPRVSNLLRGAAALGSARPLTHSLLSSPDFPGLVANAVAAHRPDVVLAYSSGMAPFAMAASKRAIPFVLDMVDVDSEKWRALASSTTGPMRWVYRREHRTLSIFERTAATAAAYTLVVNERERGALATIAPEARIRVVSNGVDVDFFAPQAPPAPSVDVVFTGIMNYAPNVEAVACMAREVWPLVRRARPDARFVIVGANPTAAVRGLSGDGIEVTGAVPDTRPCLWGAALTVAPLNTARGMQNKVLESVAAGVPSVVSPVVASGLPREIMPAIDVAEGPEAFARAVLTRLADSPKTRRARATAADTSGLSWSARLSELEPLLADAARTGRAF